MKPLLLTRDEKKHSDFSASSSHRWLHCPKSVELSRRAPKKKDNDYSLEGVTAHALAEYALKNEIKSSRIRIDPKSDPNMKAFVNDEMHEHVDFYTSYVNQFYKSGRDILIEKKFNLDFLGPDVSGTTDAAIIEHWGDIHIFDFKYGRGVKVEAEGNSQQAFYALGVAELVGWDFVNAHFHIVQPRAGGVSTVALTKDALFEWRTVFNLGIIDAKNPDAELAVGDWCRFCAAKPICPKMKETAEAKAMIEFSDPTPALKPVGELTIDQVVTVLDHADMFEDWLSAVRQHAHTLLEQGANVPGYKLVAKKANRSWVDEDKVEAEAKKKFKAKAFKTTLLSPAQLEKIAGKEWVESRVEKVSSGTKVAKASDERTAEAPRIEWEFD